MKRVPFDFTGDGRSDWSTVSTSQTSGAPIRWKVTGNPAPAGPNAAFKRDFDYGINTDDIVAADYIGDRKTDPTVWRGGTPGIFYVAEFPIGTGPITIDRVIRWGELTTDYAIEGGDYDGDGKADYTLVRVSANGNLTWYIKSSSTGAEKVINFGTVAGMDNFIFYPGADFTGDGRDEIVFATADPTRQSNAVVYYVGDAVTGADVLTRQFGDYDSDYSVAPADYTGDGRADFVAVRQTTSLGQQTWYINNSAANTTTSQGFGVPDSSARGDIQVRGDFDGDGIHDIAVYRSSNQTFYYLRSSSNNTAVDGQKHGDAGDFPLGGIAVF